VAWKFYDESIEMLNRKFRYLPRTFRWRGQRYEVKSVERCWTVSRWTPWLGLRRRVERHYFRVQCLEGVFDLYQDIRSGAWYVRRARLSPWQVPALRRTVPVWR
jgi:hypothetical protein